MERLDKKIAENHQRQDFLRKRIQSDKDELSKLESEARVLEHSQLAVVFSCEIKDVNTLVTQEHDTLMRLRSQGITDEMLEALAKFFYFGYYSVLLGEWRNRHKHIFNIFCFNIINICSLYTITNVLSIIFG